MRECEEMLKFVQSSRDSQLGLAGGKPPDDAHKWSMQRRWTVTPAGALQDKKSNLAILFARGLNSDLVKSRGQAASQLYFVKPDSLHSILTPV